MCFDPPTPKWGLKDILFLLTFRLVFTICNATHYKLPTTYFITILPVVTLPPLFTDTMYTPALN